MRPICAFDDVVKYASKDTEHAHQVALFMWVRHVAYCVRSGDIGRTYVLNADDAYVRMSDEHTLMVDECLFAIPNGGMRDRITASRLKAEGVRSGVADVMLPIANGEWHGLFLEMKRPKSEAKGRKGVQSKEQVNWQAICLKRAYAYHVCMSWLDAVRVIIDYLDVKVNHPHTPK